MNERRERRAAALAVITAAALWGTVGAAQELGTPTAAPATVAAARSLLGGFALAALLLVGRRRADLAEVLRRAALPTFGAAVAITVFMLAYLAGIRATGVAIGTLVAIGSAPAFAGLLSLLRGRPPGRRWVVGTAATVAGAAALVLPGRADDEVSVLGVVLGLVAGLAYASYATVTKIVLDRAVSGPAVMGVVFATSGLLLAPVLVVGDLSWVTTPSGALTVVWLAFGTTVVAYLLFARGLARIDAATATTLTLAEPLTAALLAVTVVGERLGGWAVVGALALTAGLVLAALPSRPVAVRAEAPSPPY